MAGSRPAVQSRLPCSHCLKRHSESVGGRTERGFRRASVDFRYESQSPSGSAGVRPCNLFAWRSCAVEGPRAGSLSSPSLGLAPRLHAASLALATGSLADTRDSEWNRSTRHWSLISFNELRCQQ